MKQLFIALFALQISFLPFRRAAITSTATDTLLGNTSEFSACTAATALPLRLISFTGIGNGHFVTLNWVTADEQNTNYFAVQRGLDGQNFDQVGKVQAAGNSSQEKEYSFIDHRPLQGTGFYRLQMVDMDGSYTYSKIVAVKIVNGEDVISLVPKAFTF
ncbi:hypothetical protein [Puia dinghuensis]|uniref:Uncharacterized protein n=1 Tax=Puia dinghuensis TaxID=1792502 RepID=A0A8J2UGI9_9BACT|nr:hypothetical protein [Puia dinghuensis]GGB12766.1 hypothetical protein GCM10011511_40510 [Puia dinghuensis]